MSAAVLIVAGLLLLFAPDRVLPYLVTGYPEAALWFAQLLGAAWLGMAEINWLNRFAVLGGIYGRPLVVANLTLYLVSSLVLLRAAVRVGSPSAVWPLAAVTTGLAIAYALRLWRHPLSSPSAPVGAS